MTTINETVGAWNTSQARPRAASASPSPRVNDRLQGKTNTLLP
jgi:hypothetical protein